MRVYRSDVVSVKSAEARPLRSVDRLDEPTGLSLSMVASPQSRFRFARQNHCSAAATSAANFRMRRDPGAIRTEHMYDMATTRQVGLHPNDMSVFRPLQFVIPIGHVRSFASTNSSLEIAIR